MERILGIDVGDKRVGVALSDPQGRYALAHSTVLRAAGEAESRLVALIQEHAVRTIVVGLPLGADGSRNPQCAKIENFCRRITKRAAVEVIYVDEHLTSEEAKEQLQSRGAGICEGGYRRYCCSDHPAELPRPGGPSG